MGHYTYINKQIAILNFLEQPKDSFLTLIVNYTRKIINNAHLNHKPPNPNTLLHNWSTMANIMSNNTRTDKTDWILFSQLCTSLKNENNPQFLPTSQRQITYTFIQGSKPFTINPTKESYCTTQNHESCQGS